MTADVKDELSRLVVSQVSSRRAELSALLRLPAAYTSSAAG